MEDKEIIKQFLKLDREDKKQYFLKDGHFGYISDEQIFVQIFIEYYLFQNNIIVEEAQFEKEKYTKQQTSIVCDYRRFIETEEEKELINKIKLSKKINNF